jgi:hypothetical protein
LLDSDCLWTKHSETLKHIIGSEKILLRDIYERSDPFKKSPHNLSRADMGQLYSVIDPDYPEPYPIWYGGELIAGKNKNLRLIADELEKVFNISVNKNEKNKLIFANGASIFDGDEFISNFVYNKRLVDIFEAKGYLKRIWTLDSLNNVELDDLKIPIWHLPAEKRTGLELLFNEVVNNKSEFWSVPLCDFNRYLGQYVGIPKKKRFIWKNLLQ